MVRLVRRQISEREEITSRHIFYLLTGCAYFIDCRSWPDDAVRSMWDLVRPHVWPPLIESLPGWRCHSWWRFEAPERRLRTDGGLHPFDDPVRQQEVERIASSPGTSHDYRALSYELYFGRPRISNGQAEYETDAEYLTRLAIWERGEQEAHETQQHRLCVAAEKAEYEWKKINTGGSDRPFFAQAFDRYERDALDEICKLFPTR